MFKSVNEATMNDLPLTQTITSENSSLISKKYISRVRSHENINSKIRSPVSFLYVDNRYHLVIYKIDSVANMTLPALLQTKVEGVERTDGETYTIIDFNGFSRFEWRPVRSRVVSKIYFTLAGDSLNNVVANDSIISYNLLCKNFSIRYTGQGPIEVFMVGEDRPLGSIAISPSDILFLKRGSAVYLMVMTPAGTKSRIPPDLLYNIVVGI